MPAAISVIPFRERPDLCAFFTPHFEHQWPGWYGPGGKGCARADLQAYANPDGVLPVGVIALDAASSPLGVAALRATSIDSHAHLGPWAAAGFVLPAHRRQGIGAALLSGLAGEAARLGYLELFCATATAVSLLQREGWTQLDTVQHDGSIQFVFRRTLPAAGGA